MPDSVERWSHIARSVAEEHSIYVVLAQLVGFEGGKGFPGGSLVAGPSGDIVASAPVFEETLMAVDIDLDAITGVRADQPLLSDLEAELPHLIENLRSRSLPPVEYGPEALQESPSQFKQASSIELSGKTASTDPLAIDSPLLTKWLSSFLVDEVQGRRGFDKGIVAISGGVDSALTAYLAVEALGAENVIGLNLPYSASSAESAEHAALVASELGIEMHTVDISAAVDGYFSALTGDADATRRGNVMARTRMIALFDQSAALHALPLGTGNKTERLLGYFTWHADDSPSVNPLGDLFKTQVWQLARDIGVPESIVAKPATADLVAGQTDEGDLGINYEKADRILHWLIRGVSEAGVVELGFSAPEVSLVNSRLQNTHWKRRMPTVAMVSQTAIGEFYLRPVDY
jgi:NAD+ synthetase